MMGEDVLELIPQKPPFVFVDKLISQHEGLTRSGFSITESTFFVDGGRFSEAGLLENMAQTAALGMGRQFKNRGEKMVGGFIASVTLFEIFDLPAVPGELETETAIELISESLATIEGKVFSQGILVASCQLRVIISDMEKADR